MADNTETIVLKYVADTKGATSDLESLGAENQAVAEDVGDVNSQLDQIPGAAGTAVKGVKGLGLAFKALLANPIVLVIAAIVGAVTALYGAFTRTASGGDTMTKIFDGLSAAMGPVLDSLGKLAQGIVSFLSGDFQKGIDQMSGSFDGLAGAIGEAYTNAGLLVDLRRELLQMNRDLTVGESELNLQMEKQRSILDDVSLSTGQRIAANNKLNDLNKELLKSRQDLLDKQLEEAKLQKEQAGADDEELQASLDRIAELTAARNNAEAERFRVEKEFVVKRNELATLFAQENQTAEQIRLANLESNAQQEVDIASNMVAQLVKVGTDRSEQEDKFAAKRLLIAEAEAALPMQIVNATATAFGALSQLAGENFALSKAFAIAGAIVNVAAGITGVFKGAALSPLGVTPFTWVQAATLAITGAAQIATIARTKPSASAGGAGSAGGFNVSRPTFGSVAGNNDQFSNVDPNLTQNVNVVNQDEAPPIRAFVMEGEQATVSEAVKAADEQSTL